MKWNLSAIQTVCWTIPTRPGADSKRQEMGALRPEMACHVMPSPSSGADADELMECVRERCLVIKSRLNRDVDQRHAGLAHQLFGVVNAMLHQPLVSGGAERGFE